MKRSGGAAVAWLLAAVFYFYQYGLRSAPAVMLPQLSEAFGMSAFAVAALAGIFYYGYAPFSLVAGAAIDRMGPRAVIPVGALLTGVGALLFGTGSAPAAYIGRFLQGAGGVFALVGAVYIASKNFPASRAATLIGATQMFGMAGGSAGQFLVGPLIAAGVSWSVFWIAMGAAGLILAAILVFSLPGIEKNSREEKSIKATIGSLGAVFRNPQSIFCGLIGGLLFIPTTILDMTWGVRFLQEAHGFEYGEAVLRSATVPLGWIVGCPLLGWLSDYLGRRKPVIAAGAAGLFACVAWVLYAPADLVPPYVVGIVAGLASGAAMLPFTVIKEANPPELAGTATGVIGFLVFTFSALLGPVFGWVLQHVSGSGAPGLEHYQTTFQPLLYGIGAAIVLTILLKETGRAASTKMATVDVA